MSEEAAAVMEAFGRFQVGDRVLLRRALLQYVPEHVGFPGVIEHFFQYRSVSHVSVLCDVGDKEPIQLAAHIDDIELLP